MSAIYAIFYRLMRSTRALETCTLRKLFPDIWLLFPFTFVKDFDIVVYNGYRPNFRPNWGCLTGTFFLGGCIPGSNWNLEMLVFRERGKPEYPEENLSEQSREPITNSTQI